MFVGEEYLDHKCRSSEFTWSLRCWLTIGVSIGWILETCNRRFFESWCHYDWEVGLRVLAAMIDLLLIRLTKNLGMWVGFSRIENLNWRQFGFSFIYK